MSSTATPSFIGRGSPEFDLSSGEVREILARTLLRIAPGARVLAIIPDKTRDDNTDLLFPIATDILSTRRVAQFDALVAQGTHGPMTRAEKLSKVGFGHDASGLFGEIFDHQW